MRAAIGRYLEDAPCQTIDKEQTTLKEVTAGKPTLFLFLRFFSCRVTRVDLWQLRQAYPEIERTGGQVAVVLQSAQDVLAKAAVQEPFPYLVICDPDRELYRRFEVRSAASEEEADSEESAKKVAVAEKLGMQRMPADGDPLQLPAAILVGTDMKIRYVHYGTHEANTPSMEEICQQIMPLCSDI